MQSLPRIKTSPAMLHATLPRTVPSPVIRVKQEEGEEELDELDVRRLPLDMLDDELPEKKPRSLSLSLTPRVPAQAVDAHYLNTPTSGRDDAVISRQLAVQTAPYGPENDPTRPPPGADGSYVFPPNRPLRSLLSGISGDKFEDPAFPGRRRESLDLGNSMGNMNPHYRSPSPSLQRAQSHEETRPSGPGTESPYSQWFRRPSLFDVAAHQRRASRGNLAHMHHPAVRQTPYDRPYDGTYQPLPLTAAHMPRTAEDANRYRNKRKRADPEQLAALVQVFDRTPFPSTEERHALALRLGMTSRSVQIWFQNRRQTTKAAQMSAAQLATIAANEELGTNVSSRHRGLSIQQLEALNDQFLNKTDTPDSQTEMQLAKNLSLDLAFIRSWFHNRRSAARGAQNERRGSL